MTIGMGCMFSWNIEIRTGDYHTIIDKETRKILNYNEDVIIGNHVWVGSDVYIGKGVKIADNSVVGAHSVVTRKFDETNVVIAGVPAKIVKRNIDWNYRSVSLYKKTIQLILVWLSEEFDA